MTLGIEPECSPPTSARDPFFLLWNRSGSLRAGFKRFDSPAEILDGAPLLEEVGKVPVSFAVGEGLNERRKEVQDLRAEEINSRDHLYEVIVGLRAVKSR